MSGTRLVAALAVASLALPASAGAAQLVKVRELPTQGAQRAFVIAGVGPQIDLNALDVSEGGHPVRNLKVTVAKDALSLAILVDSSNSMRGAPLDTALTAAGNIVGALPANVRAAVYTFNSGVKQRVPFGSDPTAAAGALTGVTTAEGTALYDAVLQATSDLQHQNTSSRVMIVASDGADISSKSTLEEATAAANAAGVRIFTIGLDGTGFKKESLEGLATRTGGTFSRADDPSALAALQASLATSLTRQYRVSFDSNVSVPGASAHAQITAPGYQAANFSYSVPLPKVVAETPGFWQGRWARLAITALAGLGVFIAALIVLRPRKATIAERVAEYHMSVDARAARDSHFLDDLLDTTEKRLKDVEWGRRLELELDRADIALRTSQAVAIAAGSALVAGLLAALLFRSPIGLVFGLIVPFLAWQVVRYKARKRIDAFADQLPDNLAVLSQSLRAGFSLLQALDSVSDNAAEPAKSEFRRLITQTRLGSSIEAAMDELGLRMASKDFTWVCAVVSIQAKAGGNMAEILDSVGETIRQRQRLRRDMKAMSAQGRMTQGVLTALPPGVGTLIYVMAPDLMNEMLKRTAGLIVLGIAVLMTMAGGMVISKIIRIDL
jgi:tight adherence protein B